MATRHLIGVVHARQAAAARGIGIVAFSDGRAAPVRALVPGDPVARAPVRPPLPDLSVVRTPRHRGIAFRQGRSAIPPADDRRVADALLAAP